MSLVWRRRVIMLVKDWFLNAVWDTFYTMVPDSSISRISWECERVELENQLATASLSTTRLAERRGADMNDGG